MRPLIVVGALGAVLAGCGPSIAVVDPRVREWYVQRIDAAAIAWEEMSRRLASARANERAAEASESAGNFAEALRQYLAAFREVSVGREEALWLRAVAAEPPPKMAARIRERVIGAARRIQPAPPLPPDAERFSIRGAMLLKQATVATGYDRAAAELRKAVEAAPWWADAYFNLALVEEKSGRPEAAAEALRLYLLARPDAADAAAVRRKRIELELSAEERGALRRLEGLFDHYEASWLSGEYRLETRGKHVTMRILGPRPDSSVHGYKAGDVFFEGVLEGEKLTGTVTQRSAGNAWVHRCLGAVWVKPTLTLAFAGDTLTVRFDAGTYNKSTCTRTGPSELPIVFKRKSWGPTTPSVGLWHLVWGTRDLFVVRAAAGGSAARAGLRREDKILAVDGKASAPLDMLVRQFGPAGTKTQVTFQRAGEPQPRTVELERDVLPIAE